MADPRPAHPGDHAHSPGHAEHEARVRAGLLYALAAYGWWGLAAFYFRAVGHVSPFEVLAHRVVWSVVLLFAVLAWTRRMGEVRALAGRPWMLGVLFVSAALVSVNWLVFIVAVDTGRLMQASLGYFINPLCSIVLGMVFLGERLRRLQWVAVGFAVAGVVVQTVVVGELPWISLTLAVSFALYGLVRKRAPVGPILGLAVETAMVAPFALVFLGLVGSGVVELGEGAGLAFLREGPGTAGLLVLAGGVTSLPLIWFAAATKRLRLTTIGFMQYISPSMQLLVAVLAFGEAFSGSQAVVFASIWVGVALFAWDSMRVHRAQGEAVRAVRRAEAS